MVRVDLLDEDKLVVVGGVVAAGPLGCVAKPIPARAEI